MKCIGLICFTVIVLQGAGALVQTAGQCLNRDTFKCKSGECIEREKECDGIVDCPDASDETNLCRRIKCPSYLFRCHYGACINPDLECDGKPDCRDGSDENTSSPSCNNNYHAKLCREKEFQCSSGQCIDSDLKCDGQADCNDYSDETIHNCWNAKCPGYTYRCKYGACVNGYAQCNGKLECYDGSDEDSSNCENAPTPAMPPASTSPFPRVLDPKAGTSNCTLPEHPAFGSWSPYSVPSVHLSPGTPVAAGTILKTVCQPRYILDGAPLIYCENGRWTEVIGKCISMTPALNAVTYCQSIYSTDKFKATCTYKNTITENCKDPVDGTQIKYECVNFYEDLSLVRRPIGLCKNGSWTRRTPDCFPVCGSKSPRLTPLIIHGEPVKRGEYPWQVAIYTKSGKSLICGGSLISQTIILTAAHCVTNSSGTPLPSSTYIVAVGKYYRKYDDMQDHIYTQISEIQDIFVSPSYQGADGNYGSDIAILLTKESFNITIRVQPVCLDQNKDYKGHLLGNITGYVTGWGYTNETMAPSEVLKELEVPIINSAHCNPANLKRHFTKDKLCAGYIGKSTSVCLGDSGGGLVLNHDGKYYITGIVSTTSQSPRQAVQGCNSEVYTLYTNVYDHMDFIQSYLVV